MRRSRPDEDWVDRIAHWAGRLGLNQTRVRWKLERWRQGWQGEHRRGQQWVRHLGYAHKICPECGQVNDQADPACGQCGARLGGRWWQLLGRLGLSAPRVVSTSTLLAVALVAVYARQMIAEGGVGALFFSTQTLLALGGHYPPAVDAGQWWRLGTAIFLHAGVWHIAFNLAALTQIGPAIEDLFGRGRMLLLFLLTGVVANLGSAWWGLSGVAIGASGAIMGLCGLAAGWGQRDRTSVGRATRNRMLKWAVYTMLFGYFIGADNAAHAIGFGAGFGLGYVVRPSYLRRSRYQPVALIQGLVSGGVTLGLLAMIFFPPASSWSLAETWAIENPTWGPMAASEMENPYPPMLALCRSYRHGDVSAAIEQYGQLTRGTADEPMVAQFCEALAAQDERCARFESEGFSAVFPESAAQLDDAQQEAMASGIRLTCDWLAAAKASAPSE